MSTVHQCSRSSGLWCTSSRPHHPGSYNVPGFQCAREQCSRLWFWCGSLLTALLSRLPAFVLHLLQVVSISGLPRRAYCKFPEPEPWSAGGASLSRDRLCGTVFRLLYEDRRWHCTLSRENWRPIGSTSDVPTNRMNIHHRPRRCCGVFMDTKLPSYLLTYSIEIFLFFFVARDRGNPFPNI